MKKLAPIPLNLATVSTPIGDALVVTDADGALRAFDWSDHEDRMRRLLRLHYGEPTLTNEPAPATIVKALDAYFAGDLSALDTICCATNGTEFQRSVWEALREIPAGKTVSYGTLADRIGRPRAVRAVGLANGSNPIGLVVPCHRVIGADGSLTGYGGGLHRKEWLLNHERTAKVAS